MNNEAALHGRRKPRMKQTGLLMLGALLLTPLAAVADVESLKPEPLPT